MRTTDDMIAAMGAIRDQVLAVIGQHERDHHGGERCWGERASVIAHLAHCLGVQGEVWEYAKKLRTEYDIRCGIADCQHGGI